MLFLTKELAEKFKRDWIALEELAREMFLQICPSRAELQALMDMREDLLNLQMCRNKHCSACDGVPCEDAVSVDWGIDLPWPSGYIGRMACRFNADERHRIIGEGC